MECRAVVSTLSDYLDGRDTWLSDNEVGEIETHLVACPRCQSVKLELSEIRSAARDLPLHTPPRAMWARISNTIEAEMAVEAFPARRTKEPTGWWGSLKSREFKFNLPQMAGAGALAAAIFASAYFGISTTTPGKLNFNGAQSALLPGEESIKAEIERKLSAINVRKVNWDPQARSEFDKHLDKIEESLKHSRQLLEKNPYDKIQQQMVLSLYNEKRQLLEDVERLKW